MRACAGPLLPTDAGMARCLAHRVSLRALMALAFLRWPPGYQLRLRGIDVQQESVQ
jgi:hypothetical protein